MSLKADLAQARALCKLPEIRLLQQPGFYPDQQCYPCLCFCWSHPDRLLRFLQTLLGRLQCHLLCHYSFDSPVGLHLLSPPAETQCPHFAAHALLSISHNQGWKKVLPTPSDGLCITKL